MKNCTNCKYAHWHKTAKERLHPSGEGECTYEYSIPALPSCRYWLGGIPKPVGGYINRHKELKNHCVYYQESQMDEG